MDEPGGIFDDYFLGRTLLDNGSIPLTFSGVLEGCRENGASYTVLKLYEKFDLNETVNYREVGKCIVFLVKVIDKIGMRVFC